MTNIDNIILLAEKHGVKDNPLFMQTLENYRTVQKAIDIINKVLDSEEITITKEYVKGRENTYLHPAIKELPKQIEIANKTCDSMIKIINAFGSDPVSGDPLLELLKG